MSTEAPAASSDFTDKTLPCKDCGNDWVFTSGEQEFYAEKAFTNEPARCKECRKVKKDARRVAFRARRRAAERKPTAEGEEDTAPAGPKVCYAFQKGECTRGDGCRFAHVSEE